MGIRKNFFGLLELDVNVSDKATIEDKINAFEKKYKDLVTKLGKPEHKDLVALIPEMREVMLDPEKRKAEAKAFTLASVFDLSKLEPVRKSLPDNYGKIEETLVHLKYSDIYDFLSRDPASGNLTGKYGFRDASSDLTDRAKELMDAYRNLADAADKMQLASLIADFYTNEHKEHYDEYIVLALKSAICKKADVFVEANGQITNDQLAKISSEFKRAFFTQKEVTVFVRDYCEYKGYKLGSAQRHDSATSQTSNTGQTTTSVPGDGGERNIFEDLRNQRFGQGNGTDLTPHSTTVKPQKNVVGGMLGIFLGSVGAHNFFIGRNVRAITQLALTGLAIISFGKLAILWYAAAIWGFIEGYLIYSCKVIDVNAEDTKFNRLRDWVKENKKVAAPVAGGVVLCSFALPLLFTMLANRDNSVPANSTLNNPPAVVADSPTHAVSNTPTQKPTNTPDTNVNQEPSATPEPAPTSSIVANADFQIQGTKLIKYNGSSVLVEVPDGITSIEEEAFRGNNSLKYVVVPNSVNSIGGNCFRDCTNLQAVFISDSLNTLGDYAFYNVAGNITFYGKSNSMQKFSGFNYIGYNGSDYSSLEGEFFVINGVLLSYTGNGNDVVIPDGVQIIHNNVFKGRTDLLKISFPNSLFCIDYEAFRGCEGLRNVVIPSSVTTVGNNSFRDCVNLRAAFVTANITHLGDYLFYNVHNNFTSYGLPNAAQTMRDYRFIFYSMSDFSISDDNWEIVMGVLLQYKGAESIVNVPDGVEIISNGVFKDRTDITSVAMPDTLRIVDYDAFRNSGLTSIELPQGLLTINDNAFRDSTNLKSVSLPDSVTSIKDYIFYNVNRDFTAIVKSGSIAHDYCSRNNIQFKLG